MKILTLISLIICSLNAFAQDDPKKMTDEFFKLYKEKNSDAALDYLFGTNKWMSDSKQQVNDLKTKLSRTIELLGEYNGYDLIIKTSISNHLHLYTFIVKYDRQPLRFSILLYRPKDNWRLQNFKYDDKLDDELEEASAIYRLSENLPKN